MLDEWCRLAVGRKAAPHLRAYYAFWENFWAKRVPETRWFMVGRKRACYLPFNETGYLEALRVGDAEKCAKLIDLVVAEAETPAHQARAKFLFDGWRKGRRVMENHLETLRYEQRGFPAGTKEEIVFKSAFEPAAAEKKKAGAMPKHWEYWQRVSSHAAFSWFRSVGCESDGSLRIDAKGSDGQPLCFLRTDTVESKALYRARCRIRTMGVDPTADVSVTIKWRDKDGKWSNAGATVAKRIEKPTRGKWQTVSVFLRAPVIEKPGLVFMLLVDRTKDGQVWFDDAELTRVVLPK